MAPMISPVISISTLLRFHTEILSVCFNFVSHVVLDCSGIAEDKLDLIRTDGRAITYEMSKNKVFPAIE